MTRIEDIVEELSRGTPKVGWFVQSERRRRPRAPTRFESQSTEPEATDKGYFIIDKKGLRRYPVDNNGNIDPRMAQDLEGEFGNFPHNPVTEVDMEGRKPDMVTTYRALNKPEFNRLARSLPTYL